MIRSEWSKAYDALRWFLDEHGIPVSETVLWIWEQGGFSHVRIRQKRLEWADTNYLVECLEHFKGLVDREAVEASK